MFKALFLLSISLGLTGCINSVMQYQTIGSSPVIAPIPPSIASKRECTARLVSNYINGNTHGVYGLFIRNITDGRVSGLDVNSDSSSLANRIYLSGSLFKLHKSKKQLFVMDTMPMGLNENLLSSGYPNPDIMDYLILSLQTHASDIRESPVDGTVFAIIDASFTRFDKENYDNGYATSLEYSKNSSAEVSFGQTNTEQYMTLTVNLIDPTTNSIVESETFEIQLSKNKKDKTFKVGRKGFEVGFTDEVTTIDSIHSAQNVLLDYAAMWIIDQFTDDNLIARQCKI